MKTEVLATFFGAGGNSCAELSYYKYWTHPYQVNYFLNNKLIATKSYDDEDSAEVDCVNFTSE